MKNVRRIVGLVWLILAPVAVIFMFQQAFEKTGLAPEGVAKINTALQWGIILFIFIPVSIGLAIFGYYSLKGEYDTLPDHSND